MVRLGRKDTRKFIEFLLFCLTISDVPTMHTFLVGDYILL